jgi:hypothetical protein
MGVGSLLVWAHLGGPFAPGVFAYDTVPGRLFAAGVVLVGIVVFHQSTHGARLPGRLLLVALALPGRSSSVQEQRDWPTRHAAFPQGKLTGRAGADNDTASGAIPKGTWVSG